MTTKKKRGPGRPKGALNKITLSVKESVLEAFERLGGVDHMVEWAKEHPTDFYRIAAKMIPQAIEGDIRHTHEGLAQELPDDELARIATAGSTRAAKEKGGASKPAELH